MDVILDIPLHLRERQGELARRIARISKKVQAQSLIRHPEDWTHLVDDLATCSEELEELLDEIKKLSFSK